MIEQSYSFAERTQRAWSVRPIRLRSFRMSKSTTGCPNDIDVRCHAVVHGPTGPLHASSRSCSSSCAHGAVLRLVRPHDRTGHVSVAPCSFARTPRIPPPMSLAPSLSGREAVRGHGAYHAHFVTTVARVVPEQCGRRQRCRRRPRGEVTRGGEVRCRAVAAGITTLPIVTIGRAAQAKHPTSHPRPERDMTRGAQGSGLAMDSLSRRNGGDVRSRGTGLGRRPEAARQPD